MWHCELKPPPFFFCMMLILRININFLPLAIFNQSMKNRHPQSSLKLHPLMGMLCSYVCRVLCIVHCFCFRINQLMYVCSIFVDIMGVGVVIRVEVFEEFHCSSRLFREIITYVGYNSSWSTAHG